VAGRVLTKGVKVKKRKETQGGAVELLISKGNCSQVVGGAIEGRKVLTSSGPGEKKAKRKAAASRLAGS